jgi:hypothetical protein
MAEARKNERAGKFIVSSFGGESVRAYVPAPLPPTPSLPLDGIQVLLEQANQALGRPDGLASLLPDLSRFDLRLRPKGGCTLIPDRRYTVFTFRSAAL